MNKLATIKPFEVRHFEGHEVRCLMREDGPWLVARDLAAPLGVKTNAIRMQIAELEPEDKGVILIDTLGGRQKLTTMNQSGAYQIIAQSRKPVGKRLRKWMADLTVAFERGKLQNATPERLADLEAGQVRLETLVTALATSVQALVETHRFALEAKLPRKASAQGAHLCDISLVKRFIAEQTEISDGALTPVTSIFERFQAWNPTKEHWTKAGFGRALTRLGYPRQRFRIYPKPLGWYRVGLKLKDSAQTSHPVYESPQTSLGLFG